MNSSVSSLFSRLPSSSSSGLSSDLVGFSSTYSVLLDDLFFFGFNNWFIFHCSRTGNYLPSFSSLCGRLSSNNSLDDFSVGAKVTNGLDTISIDR